MKITCADKTIFILRDEGDSSVGLTPSELTLTQNWEVESSDFSEPLQLLYEFNEGGWHGKITAFVFYEERKSGIDLQELKLQIEDYSPYREPG